MVADFDSDDPESETRKPRSRGTRPTDRTQGGPDATMVQPRQMPWERGGGWGQPNGQSQPMHSGGHPGFQWGGGQPGGIMGERGQGVPNWAALAQHFMQRFQNPMQQRMGMTGQGMSPPGQAPAAPPQGMPEGQQAAPGMPQPGGAPQGGPLQDRIGQLAALFGRQQPGGIVGPGQGPRNY